VVTTEIKKIVEFFTVSRHVRHLLVGQILKISFIKFQFIHSSKQLKQTEKYNLRCRINSHTQHTNVLQHSVFLTWIRPLLVIQNWRSSNSLCSHCTV